MIKFVIKRVLLALVTLYVVVTVTFFSMHLLPGGPFNNEKLSDKAVALINEKYNLNAPISEQYWDYLGDLLHGDLGISYKRLGFTVNEIIGDKFPVSAKLGLMAIIIAISFGIPAGAVAALKRNSIWDRLIMLFSTFGIAVPSFVLGTLLLYFFGIHLKMLPTIGLSTPAHFVMPAFALSFYPM